MDRIRPIFRRLCFLSPKRTLAVDIIALCLLWFTLNHPLPAPLDILACHLTAYALVVTVTALMRVKPAIERWLHGQAWYNAFMTSSVGYLLVEDSEFRSWLSTALTMLWNIVCALVKFVAGMLLRSTWLRSLGIYYLLLAGLRLLLIFPGSAKQGWQRYRACGVALLLMNEALVVMVIQLLLQRGSFHYPGPLIYLMAVYAFYALISATLRLAAARRRADPIKSAARVISLTAAMVSMLALEVALIDRIGNAIALQRLIVGATGAVVCVAELNIALYMIRKGKRELNAPQTEKAS